jgi:methionyl-tRNA synthetase
MPTTAQNIACQMGLVIDFQKSIATNTVTDTYWNRLPADVKVKKGTALFPRIESKQQGAKPVSDIPTPSQATTAPPATTTAAQPAQITIDEFQKVQLRTAKVVSAERVPKSEKLLKLQVSLGTEQRQIVAGIGKKYEPEALIGKTVVIVANLKPAKLMGIESQGMVLAAGDADVHGLATVLEEVDPGTKVK